MALIAGSLTSKGHIALTATSLTDAADRRLWDGAHVVLLDWAPYEYDTPEHALRWVAAALPRVPVVVITNPFKPRQGLKAIANKASGLLYNDNLSTKTLDIVVSDAYRRSLAPLPKPSQPRVTRECMAIVGKMASRYSSKGDS